MVKTRFQSSEFKDMNSIPKNPLRAVSYHVRSTFSAVRGLYHNEGLFALWKGIGAMVVGVMPSRAIYFSSYNKGKSIFSEIVGQENALVHLSSAFCAGITTATATNPIWLIKTRMQLQSVAKDAAPLYRNSFHCLSEVVKKEGVSALYKGLSASYLGVAEGTIQWVIYEKMKKSIREFRSDSEDYSKSNQELADYFLAAAASKLIAAVTTYPHEVLRTRLRQKDAVGRYDGLIAATRTIFREEGLTAFYGGMTAHLLRVVPNSAIMFFCYELLINYFSAQKKAL